jgi:plastocyanin
MRTSRLAIGLVVAAAAVASAGLSGWLPRVSAAEPHVSITEFAFTPATITVVAGSTVTWSNDGTTSHTATADDGSFDSGPLDPGNQFANLFAQAGTYTYHCAIHSSMHGTVVVTAAPATEHPSGTPSPTPPSGTLPPGFSPNSGQTPPPIAPSAVASPGGTTFATPNESGASGSQASIDTSVVLLAVGLLVAAGLAGAALVARGRRRR